MYVYIMYISHHKKKKLKYKSREKHFNFFQCSLNVYSYKSFHFIKFPPYVILVSPQGFESRWMSVEFIYYFKAMIVFL